MAVSGGLPPREVIRGELFSAVRTPHRSRLPVRPSDHVHRVHRDAARAGSAGTSRSEGRDDLEHQDHLGGKDRSTEVERGRGEHHAPRRLLVRNETRTINGGPEPRRRHCPPSELLRNPPRADFVLSD